VGARRSLPNLWQRLGKLGPIVHINVMSDKHNNSSDEQVRAVPQYRVRKPEGGTSAPKFAQNAAASPSTTSAAVPNADGQKPANPGKTSAKAKEIGGPKGLEPTRFGDWERDGRCVDF
jgi:hypothetical protein